MSRFVRSRARLRRALSWLAPLIVLGSACNGPFQLVRPRDGQQLTWMPLDVEFRLQESAQAGSLEVLLNGHDVTSRFTIGMPIDGWRTVRTTRLWDGMVLPGANTLVLRVRTASGGLVTRSVAFDTTGDPYADAVVSYQVGQFGGFPSPSFLPGIVLGPPRGAGLYENGFDVFSLGFGGHIVLRFDDNVIVDGPGVDFTVFENAFLAVNPATLTFERPFADPGIVGVSQDGVTWYEFPCQLVTNPATGVYYPGCAGVFPVLADADDPNPPHASVPTGLPIAVLIGRPILPPPALPGAGGDSFDLADVGLAWARYVRVRDPNHPTGDPFGPTNAGFDLDAVAAVHAAPATDANGNGVPDAVE